MKNRSGSCRNISQVTVWRRLAKTWRNLIRISESCMRPVLVILGRARIEQLMEVQAAHNLVELKGCYLIRHLDNR